MKKLRKSLVLTNSLKDIEGLANCISIIVMELIIIHIRFLYHLKMK
jgi:hypothetical protein